MRPPAVSFSRSLLILPLSAAALLLCACGQSGDLYLPDKKAPASAAPGVTVTQPVAPEATKEEEKDKKKEAQETPAPPASTTPPANTPTTP